VQVIVVLMGIALVVNAPVMMAGEAKVATS